MNPLQKASFTKEFKAVKSSADTYAYQLAWSKREGRVNKCLPVARVWLELSQAAYRVERSRVA